MFAVVMIVGFVTATSVHLVFSALGFVFGLLVTLVLGGST